MNNYNIVANTETEKQSILQAIKTSGAVLTGVSGYYTGYYIQLDATEEQANKLNSLLMGV